MADVPTPAPFTAETKIADLTVQQFVDLVHGVESSAQMEQAKKEFEISKRIFSDIENIIQVSKPFRISTLKELHDLVKSLSPALEGEDTELAIAVAVVKTPTTSYNAIR